MFEDMMDDEEMADDNTGDLLVFDGVQSRDPLEFQGDDQTWFDEAMSS